MTPEEKEAERARLAKHQKRHNKKRYHADPEKWKQRAEEWRRANPERVRLNHWKAHLRRAYGLTVEQYEAMVEEQGGVCRICRKPPTVPKKSPKLYVDHDHTTGAVRGLLCQGCNSAVGIYEKLLATNTLDAVVSYLRSDL